MPFSPDNFRRWLGAAFLTIAVGMLVAGLTVLEARLKGVSFIIYWVACFGFTGLAAMTALLDMLIVRWQSRAAQRKMIEKTMEEVKLARARHAKENDDASESLAE